MEVQAVEASGVAALLNRSGPALELMGWLIVVVWVHCDVRSPS